MVNFPAYLAIGFDGYDEVQPSPLLRSDMEGGQPKQGRMRTRVLYERKVVYRAKTLADYQSFLTWYRTTVNFGADWFNWTDPVDSVSKPARIKGGEYEAKPVTPTLGHWDITLTLEHWVY